MQALVQLLVSLVLMIHAAALPRHAPVRQPEPQHGAKLIAASSPPRANQGHLPPPPSQQAHSGDSAERWSSGQVNTTPHVNHDHWYGQDGAADRRYRLQPSPHRNSLAHLGPAYRYPILGVDRNLRRFWISTGSHFEVAAWNWPLFADWCWNCGDDFAIYGDPYHPGWYLFYNIHTGTYVHVLYRGQ